MFSAETSNLTDNSPKYKSFIKNKITSQSFSKILAQNKEFSKTAERMFNCGSYLAFNLTPDKEGIIEHKIHSANFCHQRYCPTCQFIKINKWRKKLAKYIPQVLEEYPSSKFIGLHLTIKSCHISEFKQTINQLNKGWYKLSKRKNFPAIGYIKSIEVTKNNKNNTAHPHIHALLMVNSGYFKGSNYINQENWSDLWKDCLKVNYNPEIKIQNIKSSKDIKDNVLAFANYQIKEQDLLPIFSDEQWLYEYIHQIKNTRLISLGGIFKKYDVENTFERQVDSDSIKLSYSWNLSEGKYITNNLLSE